MWEFREFEASPSALQMVVKNAGLDGPQGLYAPLFPHPMERPEARRPELPRARAKVEIRVRSGVGRLALARPKIPVKLIDVGGWTRLAETLAGQK